MMRLVDYTQSLLPILLERDLLVLLSPEDQVISTSAARQAFDRIAARRKQLIEVHDVGDPSNHILAGDIMSPGTTADVVATIVSFVRGDD